MDRGAKLVMVLVCLFALPFAGFGLYAFAMALQQLAGGATAGQVGYSLIFGIVFSAVGFGLLALMFFGRKRWLRQMRIQAEHPAEPWLWRDDWAQGRVASKTRSGTIFYWVMAVLWNGVSAPILYFLPDGLAKRGPVVYISLLFPLAGVTLLIYALRQTIAYYEFGKTFFEMSSIPGVVGGELKGTIQARFPHSPDHGIQLRLSCVNRVVTGSGNTQSTSEKILWREEASLAQVYPGPAGTVIPVSFRIPWDAPPTETRSPRDQVLWLLEAMADVPGVNYHDIFEVPVFRTSQTPAQPAPGEFSTQTILTAARPAVTTIEVNDTANGVEFYFPPARNRGFAAGTSAFCLVFGAIAYLLSAYSRAPFIFPLAFGFFALLLLYISMQLWMATTRVTVGNGVLRLQAGWLGGGKIRQVPFAEIASITDRITAQQGGGTGTPYYDIELALRSGTKLTLGRTLRSKQETEWLVEKLQRLTQMRANGAAAGSS